MEFLVELIVEIVFEIFGELIAAGIGTFINYIDINTEARKFLKYLLAFIFYGLCILLVTLSLVHKKSFLVIIALSYILVFILLQLFKFINKNILKKKWINVLYIVFKKIINYAFPIILIVFGSLYLVDAAAKVWLNILSSITIFVYFCIDMYRLDKYIKRKKKIKAEKEKQKEEDEFGVKKIDLYY